MPVSEPVKRLVWVRAGGRCLLCNQYLASEHLGGSGPIRQIGEVAHIAGESLQGPRGDSVTPESHRNEADNLMLLCPNHHTEADSGRLSDELYTEEYLLGLKRTKEAWVKFVTGLSSERTTTVLRVSGDVRGSTNLVGIDEAAEATMSEQLRTPHYLPDPRGVGLTIDLTTVPEPGTNDYWDACIKRMRPELGRLHAAIRNGDVSHVSVFAFALIPILVALGYLLDDANNVAIYDRHRETSSWLWDAGAPTIPFQYHIPETRDANEAVVLVNASGTIEPAELPAPMRAIPHIVVKPSGDYIPGPSTFAAHGTLDTFVDVMRRLLAALEEHKQLTHIHLFLATPISASIAIGRAWPHDNAAPRFTVYHRTDNTYQSAISFPIMEE